MKDDYKIEFTIGIGDFESVFGRKPKDDKEFEEFCYYSEKGLKNGHIDWDTVFQCAKETMIS